MLYCGSISKTLYSKSILEMLYSNHVIYCSIRFIDTGVLYLPRVQSYPETLIDEYTLSKDSTTQEKKSKEM
jgi:hypothetical protein